MVTVFNLKLSENKFRWGDAESGNTDVSPAVFRTPLHFSQEDHLMYELLSVESKQTKI